MPGFHAPELIIILVVALLIFGPKKLPEMGSAIGKSIKEFKKGVNELSQPKEEKENAHQATEAARLELEAIERELASKKATLAAQEAAQPEYNATPTSSTEVR
jgi:sec-independent protein translocase protein TatA